MTIDELRRFVDDHAKHRDTYSIDEGLKDNALIIERVHDRFLVYDFERGSRSFEKWFQDESEAVNHFLKIYRKNERWS